MRDPPELSREIVGFVQAIRKEELFKVPGVAETLDWASALVELDAVALIVDQGVARPNVLIGG